MEQVEVILKVEYKWEMILLIFYHWKEFHLQFLMYFTEKLIFHIHLRTLFLKCFFFILKNIFSSDHFFGE